jgi:hypothetical protein
MTIISVNSMWSRTESSAKLQNNFRRLDCTFRECFQVVCSYDAEAFEVYAAVDPATGVRIPFKGDTYPGTESVYARTVSPKRVSPILWLVDVDYEGEVGPFGPEDSPLNTPPIFDFDDIETEEEIDEDFDGYPIINANYEPIEGVKVEIPDLVLNIQRNFATYSSYTQSQYRRATNSDTFNGWPPGTARLTKLRARSVSDTIANYWNVSASIRFRYPYRTTPDKAWYARIRHDGFYERLTAGGPIVRACDGYKRPVQKKILLKADGTRETDPNNTYWLEIKKYDSLPFSALGLL